ncbi:MAG: ATP-binding cassette domain-containing protein [Ruthenibacterium sp.]
MFDGLSLAGHPLAAGPGGANGRGKSTLLRLLAGALAPRQGTLPCPARPCCSLLRARWRMCAYEAAEHLFPETEGWALAREAGLLGVAEEALGRPLATLSGGEATKVLLAMLFAGEERFLLLDEPTNHLDEPAREAVAADRARKRGFVVASHDRALLNACTTHTLCLEASGPHLIAGNWAVYRGETDKRLAFEQAQNDKLRRESKAAGRSSAARRAVCTKGRGRKKGPAEFRPAAGPRLPWPQSRQNDEARQKH